MSPFWSSLNIAESGTSLLEQDPTQTLSNPIKPSCKQPDEQFKGSMVYWYNSTSWRDDMAWAATWMYRASGDTGYLSDAYGFYRTHKDLEGEMDLRYLVCDISSPFLFLVQVKNIALSGRFAVPCCLQTQLSSSA